MLHRGAVSRILKVFGMTRPGWIRTQDLPHSERTLYHYTTESVYKIYIDICYDYIKCQCIEFPINSYVIGLIGYLYLAKIYISLQYTYIII